MRQDVEEVIRERVRGLLAARADVSHSEFGAAIGRGYAWVNAFLNGTRHANEIHLIARIARYFGVTVGYLLNESERGRSADAITLLSTFELLGPKDQAAVLSLALHLRPDDDTGDRGPAAPPSDAPDREPRNAGAHRTLLAARGRGRGPRE